MRPKDRAFAQQLNKSLSSFSQEVLALPGIEARSRREAFIEQVLESIHRIKFISVIQHQKLSSRRGDPSSDFFDPVKGAILCQREGEIDEAFWLTFLSVHFGRNRRAGWRLVRDVYGSLGGSDVWSWNRIISDVAGFRRWLASHEKVLRGGDGILRGFGNHHKYQSLSAFSPSGTGAAIESYVNWVHPPRTHATLMQEALQRVNNDPAEAFSYLYHSMDKVVSFGRTSKFDYLTMAGKLNLAAIEPGSPYLLGSTGPAKGARLLFAGRVSASVRLSELDAWVAKLGRHLNLYFGMQVLEDALCNWQKSPEKFVAFRG